MRYFKLCMIITQPDLDSFVLVFVNLIEFECHRGIGEMRLDFAGLLF